MTYSIQKIIIVLSIALLTACGGSAVTKPDTQTAPATQPAASNGKGGYYLDDGPGDNAPADIDSIPDAQPKTESPLARANKPYMALGQQYTPMTGYTPYKKQGIASWYGKRYHGKKTSTGEIYDMYAMSAAHTILPIPSYAKVTNPANGRSVIVRINDRGPFKHDRLIDLSYAAAYKLRLIEHGSGLVEVEAIDTSAEALRNSSPRLSLATEIETATNAQAGNGYYVQVGAFKNETNSNLLQKKIKGLQLAENIGIANVYNGNLYRVKLGPYASKQDAEASASNIRKQLNISAIVVNQSVNP